MTGLACAAHAQGQSHRADSTSRPPGGGLDLAHTQARLGDGQDHRRHHDDGARGDQHLCLRAGSTRLAGHRRQHHEQHHGDDELDHLDQGPLWPRRPRWAPLRLE